MKETVLLFNIQDQKTKSLITRVLLPLKLRVRTISPDDYGKKLGVLAGTLPDSGSVSEEPSVLEESMILFAGLSGSQLDRVLSGFRSKGIKLPYKAVLTPDNQNWTPAYCLKELMQEHARMTGTDTSTDNLTLQQRNDLGNPAKPQGAEGASMLDRMNESHYEMTGWGLKHLNLQSTDSLLDIGCGGGATLNRLEKELPGGRLTGVDYSPVSVSKSSDYNRQAILDGKMQIIEASVEKLPFPDNSFEKIVTVESFYFWPDPQENLKEVFRVLKPGGQFLLISEVYDYPGLSEATLKNIEHYHLFVPSIDEFHTLFTNAGFLSVHCELKDGEDWICVSGCK